MLRECRGSVPHEWRKLMIEVHFIDEHGLSQVKLLSARANYYSYWLHRHYLPAVVSSRHREWWYHGGKHREGDLPAVVFANGRREWWVHGRRHRANGQPAIIHEDGSLSWFVHGVPHHDGGGPVNASPDGWKQFQVGMPWHIATRFQESSTRFAFCIAVLCR